VSPLGLVVHAGRWYLAAHDHGRGELRTFRVDRMSGPTLEDATAAAPPDGFDAVAYVSSSLASVPWAWEVEVALELPAAEAAERIPATLGGVAEEEGVTILRLRVESLDWTASLLAGLGCGFTIRRPDELRASVAALAESLAAAAG
jgi:predicted DNA-binding transcriptional regulator YafY